MVVAEIGQNHNGDAGLAGELVDVAAWAGCDAVKVVKRDLECELTLSARRRRYDSPHAFGATYGEHRRALELGAEAHAALARRAAGHGLVFVATVCDEPSARLMDGLGAEVLKIASRDVSNVPLVEAVAALGRPMILSTGMSRVEEIDAAVGAVRRAGGELVLLHCTSLYPTPAEEAHLRSMATLAERYEAPVGFSDHTVGTVVAAAAVALGAAVVEKHITLDRRLKGTDHGCSLEPEELRRLVAEIRTVEQALGRADKPVPREVAAVRAKLGRSLVSRQRLEAGTRLEAGMFTLKSPGDGVSWHELERVVGRRLRRDLGADETLGWDDVE